MISANDLRALVIRPTLEFLELWAPSAENLLLGTWFVESTVGLYTHLKQIGDGPALGGYQIEPATHQDTWANFLAYRPTLRAKVLSLLPDAAIDADGKVDDRQLIGNLPYATAIARIKYFRSPKPLPAADDIPALGAFWKSVYNTAGGAGAAQDFVRKYPK